MSSAAVSAPFASTMLNAEQSATPLPAEGVVDLGDLWLASGTVLPNAKIGYKTHGKLNAAKNNVILYPTPYPAQHSDIEWLIGPGKALDPAKYFIIVLDQLGNGLSSSPSNTPTPFDRMRFP
jgi:homoserine O-acetyltransferase/O-succinyltransferase